MFSKRNRQPMGLGILINQRGIALAQSPTLGVAQQAHPSWHWQSFSSPALSHDAREWPDPQCLRWARQRSGFVAQTVGMALPPDKLMRFNFNIDSAMGTRQLQAHLQTLLEPALPWPISEVLWDYQLHSTNDTAAGLSATVTRPAWLSAAMQAQPTLQAEVLAMPKSWAQSCQQWCRQAGLRLVRLEPEWQAGMRWQRFVQDSKAVVLQEPSGEAADMLSDNEWAVLGGLALGVVHP